MVELPPPHTHTPFHTYRSTVMEHLMQTKIQSILKSTKIAIAYCIL